jgi:hypothetical protein
MMAKRLELATRGFGAEPGVPDIDGLADWIAEHRGRMADIMTYRLEASLAPQLEAGIGMPCAGGKFYAARILESIDGIVNGQATGELHVDSLAVIEDAAGIVVQRKGSWCALPAPPLLGVTDDFFHDPAEWNAAICRVYRTIMRDMRDTGVAGHVLVCDAADEEELLALARPNVFFFSPSPSRESLESLLEYQQQVAAGRDQLPALFSLADEYTIRKVCIIDPDRESIELARTHLDPDQITGAGYCTGDCGEYWKQVVAASVYER